jgi:hypothetical protein
MRSCTLHLQVGSFFTIDTVLLPDTSKAPPKLLGPGLQALQTNGTQPTPAPAQNSTTGGSPAAGVTGDSGNKSTNGTATSTARNTAGSSARVLGSLAGGLLALATLLA